MLSSHSQCSYECDTIHATLAMGCSALHTSNLVSRGEQSFPWSCFWHSSIQDRSSSVSSRSGIIMASLSMKPQPTIQHPRLQKALPIPDAFPFTMKLFQDTRAGVQHVNLHCLARVSAQRLAHCFGLRPLRALGSGALRCSRPCSCSCSSSK